MPLAPDIDGGWDDVADLIAANCTIVFKIANGSKNYDLETGNVSFSQRSISIRAYVREGNYKGNIVPSNSSIGVDDNSKLMIGRVDGVTDSSNPTINQRRLPESIVDLAQCRLEFDSPTGFKRTGAGVINLIQTDRYRVHESLGERFGIRFNPDRLRVN
jgi:hypothetical protein